MSQDSYEHYSFASKTIYVQKLFFETQEEAEAADWWMERHDAIIEDTDILHDPDGDMWELRVRTTKKLDDTDITMIEQGLHPASRANNLDEV